MNQTKLFFQSNEAIFREFALPIIRESPEYNLVADNLKMVLVLGDRVIASCLETVETGRVRNLADALEKLMTANHESYNRVAEELLRHLEPWLRAIFYLIDPNLYALKSADKKFTLYPLIKELSLLEEKELQNEDYDFRKISDPVRQNILLAYRVRNPITHSPEKREDLLRNQFITFTLVTFIAPLIKHRIKIKNRLAGLVSSDLTSVSQEIISILRLTEGERRTHLEIFGGREKELQNFQKLLEGELRDRGAYLFLTGLEGIGKSAICAELAVRLTKHVIPIGRYSEEVRKHVSWLPGLIFHSGKQAKIPVEIAKSIVTQANTMLLSPFEVDLKRWETGRLLMENFFEEQIVEIARYSSPEIDYEKFQTHEENQPFPIARLSIAEEIRREIYTLLEKVVSEYGPIILIIDALDEISPTGKDLNFLPETLPRGASGLLTARDNTEAARFIEYHYDNFKLRLVNLEREEIPLIIKLEEGRNEKLTKLQEIAWKKSRGLPIIIADTARKARISLDINENDIDKSLYGLFDRQVRVWKERKNTENLYRVLILLAIFEPCCTLELTLIQGYLGYLGVDLSQASLRDLISSVGYQVEGLEEGRLNLGIKAFAEHVRNVHLSRKDFRLALIEIVNWLKIEEDLDARTTGLFLSYWGGPDHVKDQRIEIVVEQFIDEKIKSKDSDFIFQVFTIVSSKLNREDQLIPYMVDLIKIASEKGNRVAMYEYAKRLYEGDGLEEEVDEGVGLMRKSAELGFRPAVLSLASILLSGDDGDDLLEEGEKWLRNAADDEDPYAMSALGNRLLDGVGLKPDRIEGEIWLRKAANAEHVPAMEILGARLVEGHKIDKNVSEGKKWLLKATEFGATNAMRILGRLYLDGNGVELDVVEGEKWFRKAANTGDLRSIGELGNRLLDGKGLTQDIDEGEKLIRKAAEAGEATTMGALSFRLLHGNVIKKNIDEGIKWLQKAAETEHPLSMAILGHRLYKGVDITRNIVEGEKWLRKAAEAGSPYAMRLLSRRLLVGDSIEKNIEEGEFWLRKAAEAGDPKAMASLGERLIKGDELEKNTSEGETWLRKAIEAGEPQSMGILGVLLLEGDEIAKNVNEGKKWLRKAAEAGETQSMGALGNRLIDGDGYDKDVVEGEKWLRKAAEEGAIQSMRTLGLRLLDGDGIMIDRVEGEKWLRKAAETKDPASMGMLGIRLMDGEGVEKNSKEGERWLKRAIKLGDVISINALGIYYYLEKRWKEAAKQFLQAFEQGHPYSGNNIAYMLRRNEIAKGIPTPEIDVLLESLVDTQDPFGLVNKALCLAAGYHYKQSWESADRLIKKIPIEKASELVSWWHVNLRNDPEGNLVIGWLVRHNLIDDPENLDFPSRFEFAREGGWKIPDWMDRK